MRDYFNSTFDLKIHFNGLYIERSFYTCIKMLVGSTVLDHPVELLESKVIPGKSLTS